MPQSSPRRHCLRRFLHPRRGWRKRRNCPVVQTFAFWSFGNSSGRVFGASRRRGAAGDSRLPLCSGLRSWASSAPLKSPELVYRSADVCGHDQALLIVAACELEHVLDCNSRLISAMPSVGTAPSMAETTESKPGSTVFSLPQADSRARQSASKRSIAARFPHKNHPFTMGGPLSRASRFRAVLLCLQIGGGCADSSGPR